jgi:hypothetical protein
MKKFFFGGIVTLFVAMICVFNVNINSQNKKSVMNLSSVEALADDENNPISNYAGVYDHCNNETSRTDGWTSCVCWFVPGSREVCEDTDCVD